MRPSLIIKKNVLFQASTDQVWDLLTNPTLTKQYMFGCEVLSDWRVGSTVNWEGQTEIGQPITYVTGKVTEVIIGEKVAFTMFDPNAGFADIPENYAHLTYQIATTKNGTLLTLIQGYFAEGENAQQRYEESLQGWDMVIDSMQAII